MAENLSPAPERVFLVLPFVQRVRCTVRASSCPPRRRSAPRRRSPPHACPNPPPSSRRPSSDSGDFLQCTPTWHFITARWLPAPPVPPAAWRRGGVAALPARPPAPVAPVWLQWLQHPNLAGVAGPPRCRGALAKAWPRPCEACRSPRWRQRAANPRPARPGAGAARPRRQGRLFRAGPKGRGWGSILPRGGRTSCLSKPKVRSSWRGSRLASCIPCTSISSACSATPACGPRAARPCCGGSWPRIFPRR